MKKTVFYLLFYFYPVVRLVLRVISGVCALIFLLMAISIPIVGFSLSSLVTGLLFLAGSISTLVLREAYTTLLLKLQPEGTSYIFYS